MSYGCMTSFNVLDNIFKCIVSATEGIFGWSGDDKAIRDWNRQIEPQLEKFLKGEHVTPDAKFVIPRSGHQLHCSADRPMVASISGCYDQLQENSLIHQDGVRRHVLTAPFQSWFRFSFNEYWDRRDMEKKYVERKEEVLKSLIEEKKLKRSSPLYLQEQVFKENGYGDDWRNWERFVFE